MMPQNAVRTLFITVGVTTVTLLFHSAGINNECILMMYLLGVLFTTVLTSGRGWGITVSAFYVLMFNFLFTQPRYTFKVTDPSDFLILVSFMITAVVSGTVTSKLKQEKNISKKNESVAETMYRAASGILSVSGTDRIIKQSAEYVRSCADTDCRVVLTGDEEVSDGCGTPFEIRGASGTLGTLYALSDRLDDSQTMMIKAICTQMGLALEREKLSREREDISVAMEREKQRNTMLRSIAHDFRSPLTAISGDSALLLDDFQSITDDEKKKLASDINEETAWLSDFVENILSMTRITEKQIVINKEDEVVDDVVNAAVDRTSRLMKNRKFTVKLPEEVITVPMDAGLITQVIVNLLDNAVKHTPSDSEISLNVEANRYVLKVSVADTGEGVPVQVRDHIFDRFVKLDDKIVDGRHGLGLGLAICKTIVEAHGGHISVKDNVPRGAVFSFTLPMT
jgi:two-component system sensor histidine kinase KdpD